MLQKNNLLPLTIQLFGGTGDEDPLNINVDDLFKDDFGASPASGVEEDLTKTMSKRINTVRAKTAQETQDAVARELGYTDYADMQADKERKQFSNAGYNPDELSELINPIIESRIKNDPRLARLEAFEAREREVYIETQLESINQVTGQQLTLENLPAETIELWGKGVELKQAYFATHGEKLISKGVRKHENGGTTHMAPHGGQGKVHTRALTDSEKEIYRGIISGITEEELSKITIPTK